MKLLIGGRARGRGRNAFVMMLAILLAVGNAGLLPPTGRASAASAVTIVAVNALNGAPLPDVFVGAVPFAGGSPVGGKTGTDGKAQVSLPTGQYRVGPSDTLSRGWVRKPFGPPVTVQVDGTSAPPTVRLELVPVAATGKVQDAKGVAVSGAGVMLLGPGRFPVGDARTGSDGSFRIGGASTSDTHFVIANPPESSSTLAPSEPKSVSVSVADGLITSPQDVGTITLPTATKFVHITVQAPGITVGPVTVNAQRIGQESSPGIGKRIADPTVAGGFDVPLRSGAWNISIFPAGDNTSATWISPPPRPVAFTRSDSEAETVNVQFTLGGAQISGRVVDGNAKPIDRVFAQLSNKDHSVNIPGMPGPGGTFAIGGITDPGIYYLQVQPPFSASLGLLPAEPREITVEKDRAGTLLFSVKDDAANRSKPAPITLTDITLRAATKTITGTIARSDGKDLGATTVNAFPAQGGGPGSTFFNTQATVSGSHGTFTLSVAPGTWQVNINPDFQSNGSADWIYAGQPVTVPFANDDTVETKSVSFVASSAEYTLTAQVKLPDGGKPPDNSVFLNVHNRSGFGRGQPVVDGLFSMRVPAGTYELDIAGGNGQYGPPAGGIAPFNVPDPASPDSKTIKLGTNGVITLTQRAGSIAGKVVDESNNGLADVHVNAWNPATNDRAFADTGADGSFTLHVGDGTYDVDAFPGRDAPYARQGQPQRVTVKNGAADKSPTFTMVSASATVTVQAVDASGAVLVGANGFAFARKAGVHELVVAAKEVKPPGSGEQKPGEALGNGQPLVNGVATLRLPPADSVVIGIGFPPGSNYLAAESSPISTRATASQTVKIVLSSPDVTIKGKLLNGTTAVTGVRAQVFAMSKGGGAQADVDPSTGTYTMKVQSGRKWSMGLSLPPDSNLSWFPGSNGPPEVDLTNAQSGSSKDFDFSVTSTDGSVTGTVKDPSGSAMAGAFVAVLVPSSTAGKPPRFVGGAETNAQGQYTVKVQKDQTYQVEAHIAPEKGFEKGYLAPAPQICTATSWTSGTCALNFQFKASDATISGTVTNAAGAAVEAFVRAWSDSGGNAFARTGGDGSFTLNATAGDKWHVQAIQEGTASDGTKSFTVSPVKNLTTSAGANAGTILVLGSATTLPTALSTTFDATSMQVLTLANGVKLTIPAGALATSGQVTVRATPKSQLPADKSAQPLDIGYTFEATDANGSAITKFNANVTIEIPYDVKKLGPTTSEADLAPSYYDTTTGTWKKGDNVTIDQTNHVAIILVDHFTDFAVLATTQTTTTQTSFKIYIPISPRQSGP